MKFIGKLLKEEEKWLWPSLDTHPMKNEIYGEIVKVEKIQEDSLDLMPSPSPSVKIQIIGVKVYLR